MNDEAKKMIIILVASFVNLIFLAVMLFNYSFADQVQENKEYLENSVWVISPNGTETRYEKGQISEIQLEIMQYGGYKIREWKE